MFILEIQQILESQELEGYANLWKDLSKNY